MFVPVFVVAVASSVVSFGMLAVDIVAYKLPEPPLVVLLMFVQFVHTLSFDQFGLKVVVG